MKKTDYFPRTLSLVIDKWQLAEEKTCELITSKYHAHDEVFITRIFTGELGDAIRELCDSQILAKAFYDDLKESFDVSVLCSEFERLTNNLIVRLSYHEPHIERDTGADLGLIIAKPIVSKSSPTKLRRGIKRQGLLCQAKRQSLRGNYGRLTEHQEKILPKRIDFLAFLFYSYKDYKRVDLNPFIWKTCDGYSLEDFKSWLKLKSFDDAHSSRDILEMLGKGVIGTDNEFFINSTICPKTTPHIKLEVTWSDWPPRDSGNGNGPDSPMNLWLNNPKLSSPKPIPLKF